jgi:glycosyltransferase involved in cell wall biosynthesis
VLRRSHYAIVGNQGAAQVWRDKGYGGPLAVIPQFGVDPEFFKPQTKEKSPSGEFVVGFGGGRLVFEKGGDLLLQAVAALPGAWRLIFGGSGPERERLQRMARQLKVAERVCFKGQIPSTRMPAFYAQLDALVLPSRTCPNWKEQFGRVLIEAMACGVPVVGSTCGEIPNVIGDAGLICEENDVAGLRRHLLYLQQQPERRRELSRRGRQRALERYTQAQIAAQTVQVYREIVHKT